MPALHDTATLRLTRDEEVEVVEATAGALDVLVTYAPGGDRPPAHLHPAQDERFEIHDGELAATVGGEARVLRPGDVLEIPRGTAHAFHNPSGAPTRARWTTTPAGRTLDWFTALDAANRAAGGEAPTRVLLALLAEYEDVFRLASAPARTAIRAGRRLRLVGRPPRP